MKYFYVLIIIVLCFSKAFSQDFYVIEKYGTDKNYTVSGAIQNGTIICARGDNNQLSTTTTLPFPFKFLGTQYTSFKASPEGYITFDAAATSDDSIPKALPTATAPKASIFAWWTNLDLKMYPGASNYATDVRTSIIGTTPNRIYIIQWSLASPAGIPANSTFYYFGIRIFENGEFEIVQNYSSGVSGSTPTGCIGFQDGAGTIGWMSTGSPNTVFAGKDGQSYNGFADDKVFHVYQTKQNTNDISLLSVNIPDKVGISKGLQLTGTVMNLGKASVTSFKVNYSVDGGSAVSSNITGINITPGANYDFTHSVNYMPKTPGLTSNIKVWTSDVNGSPDENPSNDSLNGSFFVNNGVSAPKMVFVEEATGAWCGWCPGGTVILNDLAENNADQVVACAHHNGDSLTFKSNDSISSLFFNAFPTMVIDRHQYEGQNGYSVSFPAMPRGSALSSFITERANVPSSIELKLDNNYNARTRAGTVTLNINAKDYDFGDMRINCYLVENHVRGNHYPGNTFFTQHNYYAGVAQYSSYDMYSLPADIIGYYHNHCIMQILTPAYGLQNVIPSIIAPSNTYSVQLPYQIPPTTTVDYSAFTSTPDSNKYYSTYPGLGRNKENEMYIVAFVTMWNDVTGNYDVINSVESKLTNTPSAVQENTVPDNSTIKISPNPTSGLSLIEFNASSEGKYTVQLVDLMGNIEKSIKQNDIFTQGQHSLMFDASELSTGTYFIRVITPDLKVLTQGFEVVK